MDPNATIISIDGIGAFDQISRAAMFKGLLNVEGGGQAIPFVRLFYGSPSSYLWEDSSGITHTIPQGEGGEQGDPFDATPPPSIVCTCGGVGSEGVCFGERHSPSVP